MDEGCQTFVCNAGPKFIGLMAVLSPLSVSRMQMRLVRSSRAV
jgi:hypothetical protein